MWLYQMHYTIKSAFSHISKEEKVKGVCHHSSEDQLICSVVWFGMLLYQLHKELLDLVLVENNAKTTTSFCCLLPLKSFTVANILLDLWPSLK